MSKNSLGHSRATTSILPGAWLGMVGGGQLGRMFCFAAQAMGYRVAVLDPDAASPAGRVADRHLCAAYDDGAALDELAQLCAAVSTEFENVPAASLERIARHADTCVRPAARCVAIAQDRVAEKRFIESAGVPVAPYCAIASPQALEALSDDTLAVILPGILKTARLGYDGKGQARVDDAQAVREAYAKFGNVPCVLEKRLPLQFEVSALVARGATGETAVYPLAQNTHHNGVLALTLAPAPAASAALTQQVQRAALKIAAALDYVGVLCVEFFVLNDGSWVANEMAPRPHNSGHYTIDACTTSQFEQQVRTMAALPLGITRQHSFAAMLNVLGDVWFAADAAPAGSPAHARTPPWNEVAALPAAHLHLYGKEAARRGRKMGHITCTGITPDEAQDTARECAALLRIAMQ